MLQIQKTFLLSLMINLYSLFSASYLYGKLDENFDNGMLIYIDIDFTDISRGILLYAIDGNQNQLLIKTGERHRGQRNIIFNFNGQTLNTTNSYQRFYKTNAFTIWLQFKYNNLYFMDYSYRHVTLLNVFGNNKSYPDPFLGYPFPEDHNNSTKSTVFWIGNIGPYTGKDNTVFQPSKTQLIGCVYNFRINSKEIKFVKHGDYLSPFCKNYFSETICKNSKCRKESRRSYMLDCSLSQMNAKKYCYKDFSVYTGKNLSYVTIGSVEEPKIVKLIWKHDISRNHCLMAIKSKNKSVIFYTTQLNELIMYVEFNQSIQSIKKILDNTPPNMIHLLLIEFIYPNFILKISNGGNIKTYFEQYSDKIIAIDVAFISFENICGKFEGELAFQYEPGQFIPKFIPESIIIIHSWKSLPFLIIITLLLLIIICIIVLLIRNYRPLKNSNILISNNSDKSKEIGNIKLSKNKTNHI